MKRIKSIILIIIVLALSCQSFAATTNSVKYTLSTSTLKVNGDTMNLKTYVLNGSTYAPVRAICEKLGATVDWDSSTKTATVAKGNTIVKVEGCFSLNGLTYVPLRFLSEKLNYIVDWFGASKTINICNADTGVWERLWMSGEYMQVDKIKFTEGCDLKPKDAKYNFLVAIDNNLLEKKELLIRLKGYNTVNRLKVKEILKMCYPVSYGKVYNLLISTLREETHLFISDIFNHPGVRDLYYDNRYLCVFKEIYSHRYLDIDVGLIGITYEIPPKAKDQASPAYSPNLKKEIEENQIYFD